LNPLFGGFVDPNVGLKLPWEKAYGWRGIFQFFGHHIILALLVPWEKGTGDTLYIDRLA
jgi:hypothetical protein